jgi:hypothetical protein
MEKQKIILVRKSHEILADGKTEDSNGKEWGSPQLVSSLDAPATFLVECETNWLEFKLQSLCHISQGGERLTYHMVSKKIATA